MALTSLRAEICKPMFTTDEHASQIMAIFYRHEEGIKLTEEEIVAIKENKHHHVPVAGLDEPVPNGRGDLLMYGSTAVIPVLGTIFKRGDWLTNMCGMVSTQRMIKLVSDAADNSNVSQIVLEIDSPGGMVSGTHELWEAVLEARKNKPIIALVSDAYSAAYYIASACTNIYLSSPSSGVGAIGVATNHIDFTGFHAQKGLVVTDIASEGKRTVSQNKPLDEDALAIMQNLVDSHYEVFVGAVAKGRGVDAKTVKELWAKGKQFLGDKAIKLGMADGYKSLEAIVKDKNMTEPKQEKIAAKNETIVASEPIVEQTAPKTVDEKKYKDLMNLFGNVSLANEMKNSGILTPAAFATVFGNDTSDTEKTLAAIQTFCEANNNDPVRASLSLIKTMGIKPTTMTEQVGNITALERPVNSPVRDNTENDTVAETIVSGISIDI